MNRTLVLAPIWAWLGLLLVAPLAILMAIALAEPADGVPPFALALSLESFRTILSDPLYSDAFTLSLRAAAMTTLGCLLLGYPTALAIVRAPLAWRDALLLAIMLPFWTGFLMRVNAWIGLLADDGWIARLAGAVFGGPVPLLYTQTGLLVGMVYAYLPFMILPLYATIARLDPALLDAARDLGAPPWRGFVRVTLPLSMPGILAGCALVFIPATGEFVIPELLGGPGAQLVGRVLWAEFFANRDWPMASALAVSLLVLLLAIPASLRWLWGRAVARGIASDR